MPDEVSNGIGPTLAAKRRIILVLIVFMSVLPRAVCYIELETGPCLRLHLWEESDMSFFDAWARDIASGDWLTRRPHHPYVSWHREVAEIYFRQHPAERERLRQRAADGDAGRALWNEWNGGVQFHQEPLYPYFVAVVYRLAGPDVRWVFLFQMALGVATNLLIYRIARRHFGEMAGAIAALFATLCPIFLFYELLLLRTAFQIFFSLLLVDVVDGACGRESRLSWLLAGLVAGAGLVLNSVLLPFAAGVIFLLAWRHHSAVRRFATFAGWYSVGVMSSMVPVVSRNAAVGAPLLSTSSIGPAAIATANTVDYDPKRGFDVSLVYVPRIMAACGGRMLPAAVGAWQTHPGILSVLRQAGQKLGWAWRWYEKPNNENLYYFELHSRVLRNLPISFAVIGPLGFVGLLLALRRTASHTVLLLMAATCFLPLVLFYVLSRFRAPFVAILVPFAAYACVKIADECRRRRIVGAATMIAIVAAAAVWTTRPLPPGMPLIRPADYAAPVAIYYVPEAQAAARRGQWGRAADLMAEALSEEAPFLRDIGLAPGQRAPREDERTFVLVMADLRRMAAIAFEQSGRIAEEEAARSRASELFAVASPP